jgi:broad specificity phosphatase PhoE
LTVRIHLVRHGEVENPRGIIYGRLPGYNLSERGRLQAEQAADHLRNQPIGLVWSSPLERAQETADIIAALHSLEVTIDWRVIESETTLEGLTRSLAGFVRRPWRLWRFRNPLKPSWGESFSEVKARMLAAIDDAVVQAGGKDAVIVSHQTPVLVARQSLMKSRIPPWMGMATCQTGSVTTLELDGSRVVSASYFRPSA